MNPPHTSAREAAEQESRKHFFGWEERSVEHGAALFLAGYRLAISHAAGVARELKNEMLSHESENVRSASTAALMCQQRIEALDSAKEGT